MNDQFLEKWSKAARDLGLDIQFPFTLVLDCGAHIEARLLLKNFGFENGMIIVTDFEPIRDFADEIVAAGYGFSTLSEPSAGDLYNREVFIEMLRDWTWSGPEALRPEWCLPPSDDEVDFYQEVDEIVKFYLEVGDRRIIQKVIEHLKKNNCDGMRVSLIAKDTWLLSIRKKDIQIAYEIASQNVD